MAYQFDDASTEYIQHTSVQVAYQPRFSASMWVNVDDIASSHDIVGSRVASTGFLVWADDVGSLGRDRSFVFFVQATAGPNTRVEGATDSVVPGTWQHVGVTFEINTSEGMRLYIDGKEDANSPVSTTGPNLNDVGSEDQIRLGARNDGSSYMDGSIGEVALWNRLVTAQEFAEMALRRRSALFYPKRMSFYSDMDGSVRNQIPRTYSGGNTTTVSGSPVPVAGPKLVYPRLLRPHQYSAASWQIVQHVRDTVPVMMGRRR